MISGDKMDDVSKAINDKRAYSALKSNIKSIITNLNSAIENLEIPIENFKESYRINSVSADNKDLYKIRERLIKRRNNLRDVVLVEINKLIGEFDEIINNEE